MSLSRVPQWPERLERWAVAMRGRRFQWGEVDCVLAACEAIEAMTGIDISGTFRGRYADGGGAASIIAELSADGLRGAVSRVAENVGCPEILPALARRGDAVLVRTLNTEAPESLGICIGARVLAAGPRGLVSLPMSAAIAAWRI